MRNAKSGVRCFSAESSNCFLSSGSNLTQVVPLASALVEKSYATEAYVQYLSRRCSYDAAVYSIQTHVVFGKISFPEFARSV